MAAGGIKVVEGKFPHAAAHVREAEAVASAFAVMVDGREIRKAVAPRRVGQRSDGVASGQEIDRRNVEPPLAFHEVVAPLKVVALVTAAATGVGLLRLGG